MLIEITAEQHIDKISPKYPSLHEAANRILRQGFQSGILGSPDTERQTKSLLFLGDDLRPAENL